MSKLSGKYWPVHPKPFKDELFSSWLTRVARGNAPRVQTFCHLVWPHRQIWNRDIDVYGYQELAEELSAHTNVSTQQILALSLAQYTGTVFEQLNTRCPTNWVLPVGVYHRTRTLFGLQWCPQCMETDPIPYFRKHWRLALSSCCPKHGILLADRCHGCSSPVIPYKAGITVCFCCGTDLRNHPHTPARTEAAIAEEMLHKRALDGRTMLPPYNPIFSIAYFDIWHRLLTLTAFGKRSPALRKAIAESFGGTPDPFDYPPRHEIEYLPPDERNRLMDLVTRLFPGWPFRLIAVAHASKNWASYVLKDMIPVRYHLWEPMRRFAAGSPLHYD